MSRPSYLVEESYTGAGNQDTYAFDFKIEALVQLLVVVWNAEGEEIQRVRGDDTTYLDEVTFDAVKGGGEVVLQANLPTGYNIRIFLANDAPTQPSRLRGALEFSLSQIEASLDWVAGAVQRLAYLVNRTPRLPENLDIEEYDLTIRPSSGGILAWSADGKSLETISAGQVGIAASFPGGDTGDILVKQSTDEGDIDWETSGAQGYSSRFSEAFDTTSIIETMNQILEITYTAPLISLSASGNSVREKGDEVTSTTLTAAVTKRSDPIDEVRFYDVTGGNTLLDTQTGDPASGNRTYNWTGSFDDTQQFRAEVDDNGDTGGPTTVSSTTTFTFVYPYYYGVGAAALAAASVGALTKAIVTEQTNYTRSFSPNGSQVLYFAYPASYGTLSQIFDVNNFDTINDWTLRVENITGLNGNPVSYNIYEFENVPLVGTYEYRFVQ